MDFFLELIDIFLHLDRYLNDWVTLMGAWLYLVLFAVIFCETGLVVTPILPGDSLLFAVGAIAAVEGSPLSLPLLLVLLIVAAVAGDAVNYTCGYYVGPRGFKSESSWLLNKKHLLRAQHFYEKHGGKTNIPGRLLPIIRTFAPFVAGIGKMRYSRFSSFNVIGGVAWVATFLVGGYVFGNTEVVKRNFHIVIVAIIFLSVLPIFIEWLNSRKRQPEPEAVPVESK